MHNLTIENIPGSLYNRLKRQAERKGRSLNHEALEALERALEFTSREETDLTERLRLHRAGIGEHLTEEFFRIAREEGRL